MKSKNLLNKVLNIYTVLGFVFLVGAVVLVSIPIYPYVWYRLNPNATNEDVEKIAKEVIEIEKVEAGERKSKVPPLDRSLPEGYHVLVPDVKINSPISRSKDYKQALIHGSWIVPEYGTPERDELPIILAAHRFGYSSWSTETRNRISYYNLPNTDVGDEIMIYWNQRKYLYKIYAEEESTYISDYSADLILYTCKYFNSPERIFRYAERIN